MFFKNRYKYLTLRSEFQTLSKFFERKTGLDPATSSLGSLHSTTELLPQISLVNLIVISLSFNTFFIFFEENPFTVSNLFFRNAFVYLCSVINSKESIQEW